MAKKATKPAEEKMSEAEAVKPPNYAADEAEADAMARIQVKEEMPPAAVIAEQNKVEGTSSNDNRGAAAYEIYGLHANWRTFDGRPMPSWKDLNDAVRGHWNAVHDYYSRR